MKVTVKPKLSRLALLLGALAAALPVAAQTPPGGPVTTNGKLSIGTVATVRANNIRFADQFPGADAGAEINACVADLPSTGGTCDARGFQGPQTAAATILLNKPVTLLIGHATLTLAGNPGISANASGVRILGSSAHVSEIVQAAAGAHLISNTGGYTDFEVDHLRFVGAPGTVSVSPNNGIDVQGARRVNIHDNQFTGLQQEAVSIRNSTDVLVSGNEVWSVSNGIRLIGVQHGRVEHNTIRDTQLPATTFNVAFAVDSVSGTGFQNSMDLTYDHNVVINYVNSQAFLFHDGQNVTFTGNVGDNVSNLVSISPYAAPDVCANFTVAGNVYSGTTVAASQPANSGIYVDGQSVSLPSQHVAVTGNTINGANNAAKSDTSGGIGVNYADDVTIAGNTIRSPAGNAIFLGVSANRVNIRANNIVDVQPSTGTVRVGIALIPGGSATGRIEANSVDNATYGLRFDSPAPGLYAGMNHITNVTTRVLNGLQGQPAKANLSSQYDGWLGIGTAPLAPLDISQTFAGPTGSQIGARSMISLAPASADSTTSYGAVSAAQTLSGNSRNFTGTLAGLNAEFDHFGSGTASSANGALNVVTNRGSGTLNTAVSTSGAVENISAGVISNAQPFTSTIQNAGTGRISQAIAFYAPPPLNTGGGPPIATYFAFRADSPGAAATTAYGVYSGAGLSNYFGGPVTIGGGNPISKVIQVQTSLSIGAIAPGTSSDNSITVAGAAASNACFASPNYAVEPSLVWSCYVSAANNVKLRVANISSTSITPAANSNWRVWVVEE